jgi:hypothetical protein
MDDCNFDWLHGKLDVIAMVMINQFVSAIMLGLVSQIEKASFKLEFVKENILK